MKRLPFAALATAVIALACRDQQLVQPPARGGPTAVIMDGAHTGNPDVFFLPPLVPDPTGSPNFDAGKFNPGLSPVAEVCQLTGDPRGTAPVGCAPGEPVFGPATMALDLTAEQYKLNWDTKSTALVATNFYRILVRGARSGSALGFVDVDPVDQGVKNLKTGDVVQFQDGRTLAIKVRVEQGAFGATNPDHVERVVPNRFTTDFVDVTTNTGFAGVRFVDNWLPPAAVAAGIDQVVVIIERVPVNDAAPETSCLQNGLKEIEGCYRIRSDPDLREFGPFNRLVIAGVCVEIPEILHSGAPFQLHRRAEDSEGAPTGDAVALRSEEAPFLTCAAFTPTLPPAVGLGEGPLFEYASAGWHAFVQGIGRLVRPRALYAVDLGAGGSTDGFSRFGWARAATLVKVPATDNQVTLAGTKLLLDPTVCLTTLHPTPRLLVGEPVRFTVTGGGGTVGGGTSTVALTGPSGCASAPWVLGSTSAPAGNRLTAATAASPRTVEFIATGVSVQVEAGSRHSCALNAAGQAYCWGINGNGHLGDGTTVDRSIPTPVAGGLTFAALSIGYFHTCGLTTSGAAYCWGGNQFGQVGDGTTTDRLVPTPVTGGLTFVAVSAGYSHTCGVTTSGAAYCWGYGGNGHLGDGTTFNRPIPTPVIGSLTFTTINVADATCGVTTSGAAYCWGPNGNGQLGDNTTIQRLVPTPVAGGLTFAVLSGGVYHTCGVTASGAAYCWGFNSNGQLGDNTTTQRLVPTPVAGGRTFSAVSAGDYHNCGVTRSGAAYCWGLNGSGQLGDGTSTNQLVPTAVLGGLTFAAVSAGDFHTCGATTNGVAYCWGDNGVGQVGDGTLINRHVPTAVAFSTVAGCDCWTTKASMPTARYALGVGTINGILYAVGGFSPTAAVEAYDPASNTWTQKAPLPTARHRLAVGVVNGLLYAVGGAQGAAPVATVEAYDPVTNSWTPKASMPTARLDLAVGVVNGILYAVGGVSPDVQGVSTVEAYDPTTDTWTSKTSMPTPRFGLGVAAIGGKIYAVGGASNVTGGGRFATVEAYDPIADLWVTKASMPAARYHLGVGAINGTLYAAGGFGGVPPQNIFLTTIAAYDAATDAWTTKASMPTARAWLSVGVVGGMLYAVGGAGPANLTPLATVEAYQP